MSSQQLAADPLSDDDIELYIIHRQIGNANVLSPDFMITNCLKRAYMYRLSCIYDGLSTEATPSGQSF